MMKIVYSAKAEIKKKSYLVGWLSVFNVGLELRSKILPIV